MELAQEIWEFARTDLARLFRSGKGLVLLVLFGLIEAAGGMVFALFSKSAAGQLMGSGLLAILASGGDKAKLAHLQQIPVPILFAYWFTLFVMPVLVLLMGYDQISGELSTRSVRYLAFRSRRLSWPLGKALAQIIALFGLSLGANVVVLIFSMATVPNIVFGTAVFWLLALWLLSLIYGAAYVALVTLVSSLFRTTFLSLAAGAGLLVGLGMAGLLARWIDSIHAISYALPGSYANGLLSPQVAEVAGSAAALLGFAAVFLCGAVGVLRARDL